MAVVAPIPSASESRVAAESEDFARQDELSVERSRVTEAIARLMGSGEPSPSTTDGLG